MSIREILRQYEEGTINESPRYQRGNTWDADRKRKLLFSLFSDLGYIIPPLYFDVRQERTGKSTFTTKKLDVLDGKQRMLTILEYVKGYSLNTGRKKCTVTKFGKKEQFNGAFQIPTPGMDPLYGKTFSNLGQEIQEAIMNMEIDVCFMYNYDKDCIPSIFSVLQEGQTLSMQEALKAIPSIFNEYSTQLSEDYAESFKGYAGLNRDRDEQGIVTGLLAMVIEPTITHKRDTLSNLSTRATEEEVSNAALKVRMYLDFFLGVMDYSSKSASPQRTPIFFNKLVVYATYVLWAKNMDNSKFNPKKLYNTLFWLMAQPTTDLQLDFQKGVKSGSSSVTKRNTVADLMETVVFKRIPAAA